MKKIQFHRNLKAVPREMKSEARARTQLEMIFDEIRRKIKH